MAIKSRDESGEIKTTNELNFIGTGTYLEGAIEAKGSMRIDGKVKGAVKAADTLTVGAKGEISGEVHARTAIVGGKIEGDVRVEEKLVLEANSILVGNLKAKKLVIDDGAVFQGKSDMGATKSSKPAQFTGEFSPKGETGSDQNSTEKKPE
jgi:cytoskeletal protein CcmA (bactofilin family)